MSKLEKIYSVFAVIVVIAAAVFICLSLLSQQHDTYKLLIPATIAFGINVGLMFVVFKDIYFRKFPNPSSKYIWFALILLIWPSVLIYLPLYGFRASGN